MYSEEQYSELQAGYLETWTDEQLQTRKEELLHLTWKTESEHANLRCQYHDVDEEQEVRAYYAAHPSPTRPEFKQRANRIC